MQLSFQGQAARTLGLYSQTLRRDHSECADPGLSPATMGADPAPKMIIENTICQMLSEQNMVKQREEKVKVKKLLKALTRPLNIHLHVRTMGLGLNNLHAWVIQLSGLQRPL